MTFKDILVIILALAVGYQIIQNIQLTADIKEFQEQQKELIHTKLDDLTEDTDSLYRTRNIMLDSVLSEAQKSREIAERVEKRIKKDNEKLINSFNSIVWDRPDF